MYHCYWIARSSLATAMGYKRWTQYTRSALDKPGFDLVIEAGLGAGPHPNACWSRLARVVDR
jgi:hypothetical protein